MIDSEAGPTLRARFHDEQKHKVAQDLAGKTTKEIVEYVREGIRRQNEVAAAFATPPDSMERIELSKHDPVGMIAWACRDRQNWIAFKTYMRFHMMNDVPAPPWLSKEELREQEALFQKMKDLLLLELLSENPGPTGNPGAPRRTAERNAQIKYWIDLLSEIEGLDKGSGEGSQGNPHTAVSILAEVFSLSENTIRALIK